MVNGFLTRLKIKQEGRLHFLRSHREDDAEMRVRSLDGEDPLEKEMATSSSILAWEIPWTEEPGGLQSMGLKEPDTT